MVPMGLKPLMGLIEDITSDFIPLCNGAQEADKTSKEALSDRAFVAFTKHQESLIIKQERDGARYEMLMNSRHF